MCDLLLYWQRQLGNTLMVIWAMENEETTGRRFTFMNLTSINRIRRENNAIESNLKLF